MLLSTRTCTQNSMVCQIICQINGRGNDLMALKYTNRSILYIDGKIINAANRICTKWLLGKLHNGIRYDKYDHADQKRCSQFYHQEEMTRLRLFLFCFVSRPSG